MKLNRFVILVGILFLNLEISTAQIKDLLHPQDTTDITFTGVKINPYAAEYDSTGKVKFSGYLDAYFAHYSDSSNPSGFSKFPTAAPRNNQLGINILQISAKYESRNFRGTVTIFGGDCPQSSWSGYLNYIQEANLGFRVYKKLWLDAGFFRTHFGLESIQPRENMTISLATTTYFEPYFLSGAKLTWQQSDKLAIQLNAFNSFNQFVETNKNKAVGLSIAYNPSSNLTTSFSTIVCDESLQGSFRKQLRWYNNLCVVYKTNRWVVGLENNFGMQQNSKLTDSTATATMFSSLLAVKYRITPKWASYLRGEVFLDPDEILTGPVQNEDHQLVGIDLTGGTVGFEFKPIPNSYFRIEGRYLFTRPEETIFTMNGVYSNQRYEIITALGLWF